MSVHPAIREHSAREAAPIFVGGRSVSLSSQIVGDVRDALFAKKLKPGDSGEAALERRAAEAEPTSLS